jgi:hypothetical protein
LQPAAWEPALSPFMAANLANVTAVQPTATNIADALKYPRNENSLPGNYPGRVVKIIDENSIAEDVIQEDASI